MKDWALMAEPYFVLIGSKYLFGGTSSQNRSFLEDEELPWVCDLSAAAALQKDLLRDARRAGCKYQRPTTHKRQTRVEESAHVRRQIDCRRYWILQ
jgi:hypothetical protein